MEDLKNVYVAAEYPVPADVLYATLCSDDTTLFRTWFEQHNAYGK